MKEQEKIQNEDYCKEIPSACQYSYQTSYEVKYNANGKLSIIYFDYVYTGGAHGNGFATLYNFDINTGKHYQINDILKIPANYSNVTEYVFQYLSTHEPNSNFVKNISDFNINKDTQFSFADDGINLIFQEYEVAPYAAGNPQVFVPSSVYK